jgi:glycosyltransferase involved in cell wall biosynthesis
MEGQPAVSCICMTYARPRVLQEAIHSFLIQDYAGPKELIVLNDYAGQTLLYDHPEVQVINVCKHFHTVGAKMNAAVALASHDLLFVWDDDDIYLPHRLSFSVAHYDPKQGFFKPNKAWFWMNDKLSGPDQKSLFHVGSCYARRLFDGVRGYVDDGTGYDLVFEQRLKHHFPGSTTEYDIEPQDIYYIYRWGSTGTYNMSQFGGYQAGANVGQDQVGTIIQQRALRGEIPKGEILLQPGWRTDYRQLVASHIATLTEQSG